MPSYRFEELTEEFLAYQRMHSNDRRTAPSNIRILSQYLGRIRISKIGTREITRMFAARMTEAGVARSTVNRQRAALSKFFSWAIEQGYHRGLNPVQRVKKFRESPGRDRFLSHPEAERLILVAANHLKPILIAALTTGGRMGEVLALCRADADPDRRIVLFRKETTKSGKTRKVPMTRRLAATIRELAPGRPEDPLFLYRGRRMRSVGKSFTRAKRRAGLGKDVVFPTLRHTFASWAAMEGISLRLLQKYMGHSTIALTERYAHLSPEFMQEGLRFLDPEQSTRPSEDLQE